MAGGVGLVMCGPSTRELYTNRPITTNAGLASTARGVGRLCSSTTVGVYTARREWANWELTTPFSLIALWQLDSLAGSSVRVLGYSAGGTGYSLGQSITGQRRYSIGATNAETISPLWPLGVPISSVMTYDGTNINGYFNGVLDATAASSAPTFGTFDRIGAGGDPDGEYRLDGKVLYFGLIARVLSPAEIQRLAANPFLVYAPVRRIVRLAMASAGGGINGVLASTLDAVTSSAAGTVKVQGTESSTLADVTSSAAGTVKVQGVLAATLADATLSAAGGAGAASLVLSKTLDAVTSSAAGTVKVQGTSSQTLDNVTLSAAGSVAAAILTLNATLADATLSAAGTVKIQGVTTQTLADITSAAAAAVKIQGALAATLGDVTLLASGGNAPAQLVLDATLAGVTAAATAKVIVSGVVSQSLGDATLSSTGTVKVSGTLSSTLGDVTLVALSSQVVHGVLTATLGNVTVVARGRGPFTPSTERTVMVVPENRVVMVEADDRRWSVIPEDRTVKAVPEGRGVTP